MNSCPSVPTYPVAVYLRRRPFLGWALLLATWVGACSSDASTPPDASMADAMNIDAGPDATSDAGMDGAPSDVGADDTGTEDTGDAGADPCASLECDTLPAPSCVDDGTQRRWEGGRCEMGACFYDEVDIECLHGCADGVCVDDPCDLPGRCAEGSAPRCEGDALAYCEANADGCFQWSMPTGCPAPPENASALCMDGDCGFLCDDGYAECEGRCIPAGQLCGSALSDEACESSAECGPSQACIDGLCHCAGRTRVCASGCCPYEWTSQSFDGIHGSGIAIAYAPDGTAYFAVRRRRTGITYDLHLYSLAPGADAPVHEDFRREVGFTEGTFDLEVRSDGVVFIAVASRRTSFRLFRWTEDDGAEQLIFAPTNQQVALAIDGEDNVWAALGTESSFDTGAYRCAMDGTVTAFEARTVYASAVSVAPNPSNDGTYAYARGEFSRTYPLGDSPDIRSCEGDHVVFDEAGTSWSFFRSYPTASVCRDRRNTTLRDLSRWFPAIGNDLSLVLDGEQTAFFAFTESDRRKVHWIAGRDGVRWTTSALPETLEGTESFHVDIAPNAEGRVVFAVLTREDAPFTLWMQ